MFYIHQDSSVPMPNAQPHLDISNTPTVHKATTGSQPFILDPSLQNGAKKTQYPVVTGSSVVAAKFQGGVMIACDTLGAYGRTLRYKNLTKIKKVNDQVVIAASGEMSDLDYIANLLEEFTMMDHCQDDGIQLGPKEVYSILSRVLYNRRTDFDPLWNTVVVAGLQDGEPFLGSVGMIGTHYVDDFIVTGMANNITAPLLTEKHSVTMPEEEVVALVHAGLRGAYYRDSQTINKFQLATVKRDGVSIGEPFTLAATWKLNRFQDPESVTLGVW